MSDPLAQIVALLQPTAPFSKRGSGAGRWRIHREEVGRPFYCAILEGTCRLTTEENDDIILRNGDFVLLPSASNFTMSSFESPRDEDTVSAPWVYPDGERRLGDREAPADVRLLVGYCVFRSPDASLLASLLPKLVHIHGIHRLSTLMQLVNDESRAARPARDVILERLLEVLLIEALRATQATEASPGLLRGLSDERLALAIRQIHEKPERPWTVAQLAKEAMLSRSSFYERFGKAVGVSPMKYLLTWRMALAKDLLRRKGMGVFEVADQVGYRSASAFTVAFTRHVGLAPTHYVHSNKASE